MKELPRPTCHECNLVMAIAEIQVVIGQHTFHQHCYVTHIKRVTNGKIKVSKEQPYY